LDGGATWHPSTAPLFGVAASLKLSGRDGLIVFEFDQSFDWPSEVYRLNLTTGTNDRAFREPMSRILDTAVFPGHVAYLAGVEPPGRLAALPIPGKVKIYFSTDLMSWQKMDIDYKAIAGSVKLAGPDADHLWAATDTGMILQLVR
jgi:hypothetical protein